MLGFIATMVKYGLFTTGALAIAAYLTKPDEASGRKYAAQFRSAQGERLRVLAENVTGSSLVFQDMILFHVARDKQFGYIGAFGAWFPISTF